jgi:hypothetical protein
MSPEQASGHERVDGRSDQYALACVVYEMLAGEPPFGGPTPQAVLARHAVDPVPPLRSVRSTVPRAVERVLERALAKVPADRYTRSGEFADALQRALAAPGEPETRPTRRLSPQARAILGTTVAVAVATAAAASLWSRAPEPTFEPSRVLVAPLEHDPDDAALSRLAGQLVSTLPDAVARENVGEPVPAARVRDLLARTKGTPGEVAERLARETGAGLQLRGACSRLLAGSSTCQVDLLRMPAGSLRMSASVSGDPAVPAFGEELAERMLVMLALQKQYGDRASWRGDYIPRSLAVVKKYADAVEGRSNLGWEEYDELVRLDSGWVSVHAGIVAGAAMTGVLSAPAAESMLVRFAALPNLLPAQREAAVYWLASIQGDAELAYEMVRRRWAANPAFYDGGAALFALLTSRPNATLAITVATANWRVVDSQANSLPYGVAVGARSVALHHLGRYRDELEFAREMRRRFPGHLVVDTRSAEARALAALGEVDSLNRLLDEWEATPEDRRPPVAAGTRAFIAGLELMAHGHETAGRAALQRTLPLYRQIRDSTGSVSWHELMVLTWLGRLDDAYALARAGLARAASGRDSLSYIGPLGGIAARMGRRAEAAAYEKRISRFVGRPFMSGAALAYRAHIAVLLGDRAGAVRLLEEARARGGWGPVLHTHEEVHRWPEFVPLRGYPPFEQFLRPRD